MSNKDVIIALDFNSEKETLEFLDNFNYPIYVKVGMELFYKQGPSIIEKIKANNHKIFLDLKIHDIPNTAAKAMKSLSELDIDMVNVHCAGGIEMMKAAKAMLNNEKTIIIGVTMLTSTSQKVMNEELLIPLKVQDVVLAYAKNAKEAGLDGIVCSPLEAKEVHEQLGKDFLTITPGIRYNAGQDDQIRVMTPQKAKEETCDYIVVGRPITQSSNPKEMYEKIKGEFINE
ncbi:orotidine-5'-phosphate decarboxylase [Mycoplasma sp. P36-A1]|uniref:orotidine-5'-phosphate decarboxylase n=1 Tax=Mycoplasma sp. P36-A1 TaxID=3252900 RepID=UPI003C2B96C9